MNRTGLQFYVEGEYCLRLKHLPDPNDEDWILFNNEDINPFDRPYFVVWSQFDNPLFDNPLSYPDERERLINQVVMVIDWLRGELGWEGFCANLWLYRGEGTDERAYKWELC